MDRKSYRGIIINWAQIRMMGTLGLTTLRFHTPGMSLRYPVTWLLLLVIGSVLIFYWPSFVWLGGEWASTRGLVSHGYLIAGICLLLLFRSLRALPVKTVAPCWMAFPVVVALSLVWSLAFVANVAAVQTMLLPIIILTSILAAFGRTAMSVVTFAVLYLYFSIPAWDHLRFIFQDVTTDVVGLLIRIVDIPVYIQGNFVHVPAGTFEISGGCSGLGFILVGTSLATLYGHLFYDRMRHCWMLVGVAFSFAVLINWIRVFSIVLIGNATDMKHPLIADHSTFGWFLFSATLIPLFYIAYRLQPTLDKDSAARRVVESGVDDNAGSSTNSNRVVWASTGLVLLSLASVPVWAYSLSARYADPAPIRLSLPAVSGRWSGPESARPEWEPRYSGVSKEILGEYRRLDEHVWLYANVYQTQSQDRELIYFKNTVAGDLRVNGKRVRLFDSSEDLSREVVEIEAEGINDRWLIWYWYEVDGRRATGDAMAKFLQGVSFITGNPSSGVVALATHCSNDCAAASIRLQKFAGDAGDALSLNSMITAGSRG